MAYTNSPLVDYTELSPNNSGTRTHAIDRITPHSVVGQCSVEVLGAIFANPNREASSNYGVGPDGRIGLYVPESKRSWCSSSNANDQRAITIEIATDTYEPYAVKSAAWESTIKLCTDICKRNGKTKLLWFNDKDKTLNYNPKSDEMILTVHKWFGATSCPNTWILNHMTELATKVTAALGSGSESEPTPGPEPTPSKYPATPFLVDVLISDLNIRKGPGMGYSTIGKFTGKGKFTIVAVSGEWGKLKSGAGWIYIANSDWVKIGKHVEGSAPALKSIDEIAKEVIAGKWYNGAARKSALIKAGYDYNAVQAKVNELMK